jgi:hypothetical protein
MARKVGGMIHLLFHTYLSILQLVESLIHYILENDISTH